MTVLLLLMKILKFRCSLKVTKPPSVKIRIYAWVSLIPNALLLTISLWLSGTFAICVCSVLLS